MRCFEATGRTIAALFRLSQPQLRGITAFMMIKPLFAATILLAVSACSTQPAAPPPKPAPAPTPVSRPVPAPLPVSQNWMDMPKTPGDWNYVSRLGGSSATFAAAGGQAYLTLQCDNATRSVALIRAGTASGAVPLRILAETGDRLLNAQSQAGGLVVQLAAQDALLDAMAISKGRFAVEVPGLPTLYIPSWPEVSRVIEDCR